MRQFGDSCTWTQNSSYLVIKTMFGKSVLDVFKKFPTSKPLTCYVEEFDKSKHLSAQHFADDSSSEDQEITAILQDHFITIDGVKVRYLEEGTGPPIVLIHGFGVSSETWRRNIQALSSKWQVIAPDLVGHGKSDRPFDATYSIRYYVNFIQTFLKLLDVRNRVLIGHSMGGLIAIRLALDATNDTKALVLEDSAGLGGGPSFRTRMAFLSYLLRMSLLGPNEDRVRGWLKTSFYNDPSKISEEAVKRALESWKDTDYRRVQRKTAMGLRKNERRTSWFIEQIKVPTLIIWGEKDKQIPAKFAHKAAKKIENSKVEIIPECGHAPHGECSEEFNARVLAFLNGVN